MPKIIQSLSLVLLFLLSAPSFADTPKVPKEVADDFMQMIANAQVEAAVEKHVSEALRQMMGGNLQNVVSQLIGWNVRMGKIDGFELVYAESISTRTKRFVYIMHHEGLAVIYSIYLYKTASDWKITNFTFNTDFKNLAKQLP